jgi:hypothetical protein
MKRPKKPQRDPDIEKLVSQTDGWANADIYHNTFLSRGTIANLRGTGRRKTRYPTHMTMVGVAAAVGLEWRLVKK